MRLLVPALPFTAFMSRLAGICFYLLLAALLTILPLRAFAQEERTAEKAAAEKARREAAAKQQASPEPAKQADETSSEKKSEDEKAEEEKKPADPMSTGTFNGLKFRSIGPAFTSGRVVGFAGRSKQCCALFRHCRFRRGLEDRQ